MDSIGSSFMITMFIFIALFPFVLRISSAPTTLREPETAPVDEAKFKLNLKEYTDLLNAVCNYLSNHELGRVYAVGDIQEGYVIVHTVRSGSKQIKNVSNDVASCVKVFYTDLKPERHVVMNGEENVSFLSTHDNPIRRTW